MNENLVICVSDDNMIVTEKFGKKIPTHYGNNDETL